MKTKINTPAKAAILLLFLFLSAILLIGCGEKDSALKITPDPVVLGPGETVTLTTDVKETVEFTSSDEKTVTVSADGIVTGIAPGTAKITAKAGKKSGSVDVTVKPYFNMDESEKNAEIYGAEGLKALNNSVNNDRTDYTGYTFTLKSDADFNGEAWIPLSGYKLQDSVWEGNGHTISDLKITQANTSEKNTGNTDLNTIGFISGTRRITMKNIAFENIEVSTQSGKYCGIVIGYLDGIGVFENITVKNSSIETASSSGTGAILGFINDTVHLPGETQVSSLEMTGCTIENVTVKSGKSAGLVGRLCNGIVNPTSISGDPTSKDWYALFYECTVTNCNFYVSTAFGEYGNPAHWAANGMEGSIGSEADSDNTLSGNKFFFNNVEYIYDAGTYTPA